MQCTCGFENGPEARFCGKCGLAIVTAGSSAASIAPISTAATRAPSGGIKAGRRGMSGALLAIVALVLVSAAGGYWWSNRPPERHKRDNSGLYGIAVDGKYGFMDRSGKIIIAPQFEGTYGFSEGLAAVRVGTKFGFIDAKGKVVITPQFDEVSPFSEGLAAVKLGTKYGYINTKGLVAITPQFNDASSFNNGRAAVKLQGPARSFDGLDQKVGHVSINRYAFINKDGKYIGVPGLLFVQWDFGGDSGWTGDVTLVRTAEDRIGILNESGKIALVDGVDEIGSRGFTDGLAPAAKSGKWGYIDTTGKWAIEPQFEQTFGFQKGLAEVEVGGRWGFVDQKGKFVVNPQYDGLGGYSEGYSSFESGKGSIPGCQDCASHGFLDSEGRVVVQAKFVEYPDAENGWSMPVSSFSEGLAAVKTLEGWGFIDPTGKMVIAPQFDRVGAFQGGLAQVWVLGKGAFITTSGAFAGDPFPGTTVLAEKARIAAEAARAPSPSNFVGVWWLEPGGGFLRIAEATSGQLVLAEGSEANWRISWGTIGVQMGFAGGRLQGQITSYNFRATHGAVFEYTLTVDLMPNGTLQYNLASALGNESRRATRLR